MENNMIYSYENYEMSYREYAEMLRSFLLKRIDLKDGILQPFVMPKDRRYNIPLIDIRWKGNVHLVYYMNPWHTYYRVERNKESVSKTWLYSIVSDKMIENFQRMINEVNDHKYDNKKSYSDKINEIIINRGLAGYMNNTKWSKLTDILMNEVDVDIEIMYKTLFDDTNPIYFWDINGDEDWQPSLFKSIEWFKFNTIYKEHMHKGLLLDDEILSYDFTDKILKSLDQYNIPYEETKEPLVIVSFPLC